MSDVPPPPVPTQLIVFADDWGRHPSSSQHLIRELLPQYPTLWVNTVGTRRPRLGWHDLKRAFGAIQTKLLKRLGIYRAPRSLREYLSPEGLTVIQPFMYPGFRKPWQRRLNASRLSKAVSKYLLPGHRHVVLTTLPITADLPELIRADRWIYYCVDDYSKWPGTDHCVMEKMEIELVLKVADVVAVSQTLADRMAILEHESITQIGHGINPELWVINRGGWDQIRDPNNEADTPHWWQITPALAKGWQDKQVAMFWGLIDQRLDLEWLRALYRCNVVSRIVLVGPTNAPHERLADIAELPGAVFLYDLVLLAEKASVLIMPYIDAPVTRAMQPLKLLEYLATMKPVVVRDLPSTRDWADCCDLASSAEDFVRLVAERAKTGTPPEQLEARRRRLAGESWTSKAAQLAELVNAD